MWEYIIENDIKKTRSISLLLPYISHLIENAHNYDVFKNGTQQHKRSLIYIYSKGVSAGGKNSFIASLLGQTQETAGKVYDNGYDMFYS